MAGMGEDSREITDALDAAGNTTAAIGKGFAIGSAALVSLALFGAYVTRAKIDLIQSSILDPKVCVCWVGGCVCGGVAACVCVCVEGGESRAPSPGLATVIIILQRSKNHPTTKQPPPKQQPNTPPPPKKQGLCRPARRRDAAVLV